MEGGVVVYCFVSSCRGIRRLFKHARAIFENPATNMIITRRAFYRPKMCRGLNSLQRIECDIYDEIDTLKL